MRVILSSESSDRDAVEGAAEGGVAGAGGQGCRRDGFGRRRWRRREPTQESEMEEGGVVFHAGPPQLGIVESHSIGALLRGEEMFGNVGAGGRRELLGASWICGVIGVVKPGVSSRR